MNDKYLTEKEWKSFSKSLDYKDAALLKALAALDKAEKTGPEAQLEALDELEKQSEILLKANKADKPLAAYLKDLGAAVKDARKAAEKAAEKTTKESEQDEGEDEESPALLTTRMVPLLREVRKGVVLQAMIATAGKDTVVLVSRKPIGPPRRKLLTTELGTTSGVKFVMGECLFEANAHTFVVQSQAAGMAKKIKEALLKQTEQRFKVRVRGEDPNDIDDDGEPAEPDPDAKPGETTAPTAADPGAEFNARLAKMMPRVKDALAAAGPSAQDIKLKVSEAGMFARKKEFGPANALLDGVDKLLAAAGNIPPAPPLPPQAKPPVPAPTASTGTASLAAQRAAAKSCLEIWRDAKESADVGLSRLQSALKASDDPALLRIADQGLHAVSKGLQVGLRVALENFARQTDPAGGAADKLRGSIADFRRFLDTDPAIQLCDDNPFDVTVSLRATLGKALTELDSQLDAVAG